MIKLRNIVYNEKLKAPWMGSIFTYVLTTLILAWMWYMTYTEQWAISIRWLDFVFTATFWLVVTLISLLILVWDIVSQSKSAKRRKTIAELSDHDRSINTHWDYMTFKIFKKNDLIEKKVAYADVNELWTRNDEDDWQSQIIYVNEGNKKNKYRYEFFASGFDRKDDYEYLKELLEEKCKNISNR